MEKWIEKLKKLYDYKQLIQEALWEKGCNIDKKLSTYAPAISYESGITVDMNKFDTNIKSIITAIDFSKIGKVKGTTSMFSGLFNLSEIKNIQNIDVSESTDISSMFSGCRRIKSLDLSSWNVKNITNIKSIFYNCDNLESVNLKGWNTENVINAAFAFESMSGAIEGLESLDFEKLEHAANMFYKYQSPNEYIDLSNLNFKAVKGLSSMFALSNFVTIKLDNWDTSHCSNMLQMFWHCTALKTLSIKGFDFSGITRREYSPNTIDMFEGATALENVIGPVTGITLDFILTDCESLTRESTLVFINGLYDYGGTGDRRTFYIHKNVKDRLNDEDKALAIAKNWSITWNK